MDASYEVKELYVPENKLQLAKSDAESLLTLEINKVLCVHCLIAEGEKDSLTSDLLLSRSTYNQNTCTGYRVYLDTFFPLFPSEKSQHLFFLCSLCNFINNVWYSVYLVYLRITAG